MNANQDLERRIADFYAAEAPGRAPDWVLGAVLSTIDTTSQRRVSFGLPRRFHDMNMYAKLAVAAVVVIVAGAVGLAIIPRGDSRTVGTDRSPSPTVSTAPSASPSPESTPLAGVVGVFTHPFTYVLPVGVGWDLPSSRTHSFEFRIPDSGGEGVSAVGVIGRAFTGGRADPCAASSAALTIPAGPDAVIEYLKTIPTVQVAGETPVTIDGRPAVQALVTLGPATPDCPDVRPFTADGLSEETEVISNLRGVPVRVTAFDIDGDHIVLWTFLTVEDQSWYEVADELIASFRFE